MTRQGVLLPPTNSDYLVLAGPAAVFGYFYRNDQRGCQPGPVVTWLPFAREVGGER
jgi:hypothetical protein